MSSHELAFETDVDPQRLPPLGMGPVSLMLIEPLPHVCIGHGKVAVACKPVTVTAKGLGAERPSWRTFLRAFSSRPGGSDAILRFDCPACTACLHEIRRYRWITLAIVAAMILAVGAVYLARHFDAEQLYLPLAFVILPGCFPIGLLAAILMWQRSSVFADVRIGRDHSSMIVNAHPDFVAAVVGRQLP